jgi:hypothetical protein
MHSVCRTSAGSFVLSAMSLQLVPAGAAAQASGPTLRGFVEAQCAAELATFEAAVPAGQSIWQRAADMSLDASGQSTHQVGAWLGSVSPVIDALVVAQSTLRPEQRSDVASRLGGALNLTECLRPNSAQLGAYIADGPSDAAEVIKSSECIVDRATNVHEAMLSDMGADALRAFVSDQVAATRQPDCEVSR